MLRTHYGVSLIAVHVEFKHANSDRAVVDRGCCVGYTADVAWLAAWNPSGMSYVPSSMGAVLAPHSTIQSGARIRTATFVFAGGAELYACSGAHDRPTHTCLAPFETPRAWETYRAPFASTPSGISYAPLSSGVGISYEPSPLFASVFAYEPSPLSSSPNPKPA